jgi:acyl-CoA thioesterase FadM
VDYLRPAVLHDEVIVTAELEKLTGATIVSSKPYGGATLQLIDATVRVACLDASTMKARPIPKDLFMEWRNAQ